MTSPRYAADLAERRIRMIDKVPDTVPVVQLAMPKVDDMRRRLDRLFVAVAGEPDGELQVKVTATRTVLRGPAGSHGVGFHPSGAIAVRHGMAPFDHMFERDPGNEELTGMVERAAERLGLHTFVPEGE